MDSTVAENASQNRDFLVLWGVRSVPPKPPSYGPDVCLKNNDRDDDDDDDDDGGDDTSISGDP